MKKVFKVLSVILAIVGVVAIVVVIYSLNATKQLANTPLFDVHEIAATDLDVSIQGTGSVQSSNTKSVFMHNSGKVENLSLEVGDTVKEGDLLFTVYNESLKTEIDSLKTEKKQQSINSDKLKDSLDQYELRAPRSGTITQLKVAEGDEAAAVNTAYGYLMQIRVEDTVQVVANVSMVARVHRPTIVVGQTVYLRAAHWVNDVKVPGTVTSVNISATGDTFVVDAPYGSIPDNSLITVYEHESIGDTSILGEGTSTIPAPVKVSGTGKVKKLHVREGQKVNSNDLLIEFDTRDVDQSLRSTRVTQGSLNERIADKTEKLNDNEVIAPISGIIQALQVSNGQVVSDGMNVATIVDNSAQEIVIEVDELDVPKVKLGQKCTVRVDALPDDEFDGEVTNIAELGKAVNGITTYDVTIQILNPRGIKIAMSATAEIFVDRREGIVTVPVNAVERVGKVRRVRVMPEGVTLADQSTWLSDGKSLQPYEWREVETGLTDDISIEIVSGIEIGETVLLPLEMDWMTMMQNMQQGGPAMTVTTD